MGPQSNTIARPADVSGDAANDGRDGVAVAAVVSGHAVDGTAGHANDGAAGHANDGAAGAAVAGCPYHAEHAAANAGETRKALPDDALERAQALARGDGSGRTGILLVNHGSVAKMWRRMLLDVQTEVASELLAIDDVSQVRTAFMEYTEPSIASQLRAFDADGIESVLVIPLLLTISDHSFDDIPTICGQRDDARAVAGLIEENIEVYRPAARVDFAPLLDFSDLVRTNLARRVGAILGAGADVSDRVGLVLIGYGSAEFDDEWNGFFMRTREAAEADLGIAESTHAWCGHLVDYQRGPTMDAINGMLARNDRVIVVPQLVSYDPMFQERIIGRSVRECDDPSRVLYSSDSILPDPEVGRWVVRIAREKLGALESVR